MGRQMAMGHQSLVTFSIITVADVYSIYLLNAYCVQNFVRGARKTRWGERYEM